MLGVLLLLFGGVWIWRATHPPLTDEQQIMALMEDARSAIATRNTNRLASYLADDFNWNGQNKRELESTLRGAFFQTRDLEPSISGVKVSVQGETARATGNYSLRYRMQNTKTTETRVGRFQIALEKRDGTWKIVRAQSAE
jgi:ketosteroid isomerase-like protein